jgi:transcriptional regulator with XRE-family HTH domain
VTYSPSVTKRTMATDQYVGSMVRMKRTERGLSQTALAGTLGVTFQQVQKYEKGVNRISMGRLEKIAQTLQCAITEFMPDGGGTRDPNLAPDESFVFTALQSRNVFKLVRAFQSIEDDALANSIVAMVEAVAEHQTSSSEISPTKARDVFIGNPDAK